MPTALVTGGGIRIGRAICLALGRAGYDVVVHANRSVAAANEVVRGLAALGRTARVEQADLSTPDGTQSIGQRIDRLDMLVNNAAANFPVPAEDMSPNAWRTVVDITLTGTFLCAREFGRRHLAAGTPGSKPRGRPRICSGPIPCKIRGPAASRWSPSSPWWWDSPPSTTSPTTGRTSSS
jgi:NAD(P)-dependent dehydrogenase (short-subunit alcohol dehydrogenase family)